MKFGKSTAEVEVEQVERGDSDRRFMKYLRDGENTLRILDEPGAWVWYWEHYNDTTGKFPFPCTGDRNSCPGCTSPNEKVNKASRRVAMNVFDGKYTNVWKLPKTVAEKLKLRAERIGTITDRDYTITRIKTGTGASASYDFDIEGNEKEPLTPEQLKEFEGFKTDPEDMLAEAYEEAWGTDALKGIGGSTDSKLAKTAEEPKAKAKKKAEPAPEEDPWKPEGEKAEAELEPAPWDVEKPAEKQDEKVITEAELRAMPMEDLLKMCQAEGFGIPPKFLKTTDAIVDWMLESM